MYAWLQVDRRQASRFVTGNARRDRAVVRMGQLFHTRTWRPGIFDKRLHCLLWERRPASIAFVDGRKTAYRAVSQGAQAGRSEAYSQYAAATARRSATPDHGYLPGVGRRNPAAHPPRPTKNGVSGRQPRRASRAARGVLPVRRCERPAPRNAGSRLSARRRAPKPRGTPSQAHEKRRLGPSAKARKPGGARRTPSTPQRPPGEAQRRITAICQASGAETPRHTLPGPRKTASRAVSQGAQAGRREAYSQYAAATARRRATPDHGPRRRFS